MGLPLNPRQGIGETGYDISNFLQSNFEQTSIIFEMKKVESSLKFERNQRDMRIDFSVSSLQIRENEKVQLKETASHLPLLSPEEQEQLKIFKKIMYS